MESDSNALPPATPRPSTSSGRGASPGSGGSPLGASPSRKKAKRQTKGPTLKPQGVTKSTPTAKKNATIGALHRFAADPKRKNVGVGFKAFEASTLFVPHPANQPSNKINQQYEFQQVETPATIGQFYASGLYASPGSSTSASSPFVMDSAALSNSATPSNSTTPLNSTSPTNMATLMSSFTLTNPAFPVNSSTPMNSFTPANTFASTNGITPTTSFIPTNSFIHINSFAPRNTFTPTNSFAPMNSGSPSNPAPLVTLTTPTSNLPTVSPSSEQHHFFRKRSADAQKASEPKRQKTDPFVPFHPPPAARVGLSALDSNITHASSGFVIDDSAKARAIHSPAGQSCAKPDDKPTNTLARGCDIASLLNHPQAEGHHHYRCQNPSKHSQTLSASFAGDDSFPVLTSCPQVTLATPARGESVSSSASHPQNTPASSQKGSMSKRKYEVTKDANNEHSSKRAKMTRTLTEPARKSKGGRPRNPPKPPRVRTSLPMLTSKSPVGEFPLDLWNEVFGYSAPGFLLKTQFTCRLFNTTLRYDKIWGSARRTTYPDCPSPPAGMSEREYAFHLDGTGCQAMINGEKCPDKCRKTYWAFQKKWCANHLKERLITGREVQDMEANYPDIRLLVPSAGFDSWNGYLCAGRYTAKPAWLRCLSYKTFYLAADVHDLTQEYDSIRATQADGTTRSPAEVQTWVDARKAEVASLVRKRQEIEAWVETKRLAELNTHQNQTQAKKDFYKAKALTMSPALEFAALELTRSYQNAIAIKKAPTERSWQILEEKLETERHYAEEIVRLDREAHPLPPDDHLGFGPFGVSNEMTKEGRLVIDLTQQQITAADLAFPNATATDEWVPRILNGFYEAFEALPYDEKLDDNGNAISLTMYHAKLVAQQIESHFQIARGNPIPQHLTVKCPLCPHKGTSMTRSFEQHVNHIGKKHARSNPGFTEWRMFDNHAFRWMRVPWPRNLPVLRRSETSNGQWDLGG